MFYPEVVVFDMDGLMFDTERLLKKHAMNYIASAGIDIPEEVYDSTIGSGSSRIVETFSPYVGKDFPYKETVAGIVGNMKKDIMTNGLPIKKGLISLLKYLKKINIPCCVASSSPASLVKQYLHISGVEDYFSHIISGDDVKVAKPNPDIFNKAIGHFEVEPENALVLEDSKNGILAANKANIPSICIPDLILPDEDMINNATLITANLENVKDFIGSKEEK